MLGLMHMYIVSVHPRIIANQAEEYLIFPYVVGHKYCIKRVQYLWNFGFQTESELQVKNKM